MNLLTKSSDRDLGYNVLFSMDEEAPPEQSCTNLLDTTNINDFEAVSVEFELDDAAANLDSFPEDRFRDQM